MDTHTVLENVRELSAHFATERCERQQRRELVAADFARVCPTFYTHASAAI